MTYGIKLKNAKGVEFYNDALDCFGILDQGVTAPIQSLVSSLFPLPAHDDNVWGYRTHLVYKKPGTVNWIPQQVAASAMQLVNFGGGFYGILPAASNSYGLSDMAFYRLSADRTIIGALSNVVDFPDPEIPLSNLHFIWEENNQPLDYKIVGTSKSVAKPGNYGMQIFNADGAVLFDSRIPTFSITYAAHLSAADINDVVRNGNPRTITLPEIGDWWVSLGTWMQTRAFYDGSLGFGESYYRQGMTRINLTAPDQVTISGAISGRWIESTDTYNFEAFEDATLLFHRAT